jgi:type 1 glutamine amidotransferase
MMKKLFSLLFGLLCFAQLSANPVLHYTETTGYNHGTADDSEAMFYTLGQVHGWTITSDATGSEFSSLSNLQQYAVVVFSNTSGNSGLTATQRANFEAYIANGGSYLGIHAASDTYRHSSANGSKTGTWDWYAENVAGASVQMNPNHTSSSHTNAISQSLSHPSSANLPSPWTKTEEYYYWQNGYLSNQFTEVLRVGQTGSNSYDAPRMVAHCRDLPGGGRAFYTSLGHSASNYSSNAQFIQLIEDAMLWVLAPQTSFGIDLTPPEVVVPKLEDGYFYLDNAPEYDTTCDIFDLAGRQVATIEVKQGRVEQYLVPGIWTYHLRGGHTWTHGVRQ